MRAVALISALAMLASLFLPWIGGASFGGFQTPWGLISTLKPDLSLLQAFVQSAPVTLLTLLGSLILAALFILGAALGYPSRGIALITGALTLGTLGTWLWGIRQGASDAARLGLEISRDSGLSDIFTSLSSAVGTGAWCWAIGGALMFITGCFGYGHRR